MDLTHIFIRNSPAKNITPSEAEPHNTCTERKLRFHAQPKLKSAPTEKHPDQKSKSLLF